MEAACGSLRELVGLCGVIKTQDFEALYLDQLRNKSFGRAGEGVARNSLSGERGSKIR